MILFINIIMSSLCIAEQKRGRYAAPSQAVTSLTGTRSKFFQFNEFSRIGSLIKPVNLGGGASQSQENPAGNSSSFDFTPAAILTPPMPSGLGRGPLTGACFLTKENRV